MAITFHYGSGSPFSWRVWLALEHKHLAYEFRLMSLQSGELKRPEYLATNPRGKVPTLIDDGFAIRESAVILEYLEERYPDRPILPRDPRGRATARRVAAEVDHYFYPVGRRLFEQTLFRSDGAGDSVVVSQALAELKRELSYLEGVLDGDYFAGSLSLADFTLYPMLALVKRLHERQPQHAAGSMIGPKLAGFMRRIEQLPYFLKTIPPHWKE
jgi:glutathione S-transferase